MSSTTHALPLKTRAKSAAADTNCTAVALAEFPAAFMPFQRQTVKPPADKNIASADPLIIAAMQFSGTIAQIALMQKQLQYFEYLIAQ
jgi:hypothetical protein